MFSVVFFPLASSQTILVRHEALAHCNKPQLIIFLCVENSVVLNILLLKTVSMSIILAVSMKDSE